MIGGFRSVFTRGLSTCIEGHLYANLSITRSRKFNFISQSGWIVFQANHNTSSAYKAVTRAETPMASLFNFSLNQSYRFLGKYHSEMKC